ncbi:bZIP transcription factor [Paracoccus jeotgali]|uniref:bZIP transcription factor n=1 Tax=Paracoccus jeotgali TaxID=2065379 RepID=UPI0028A94EAD|nr:bZIP transcription factor [Paracoccus jeotgali]
MLPQPSPIERHLLDLVARIDQRQDIRIAALEAQVEELVARNAALEAKLAMLEAGVNAFSASLDSYLDPSAVPPV